MIPRTENRQTVMCSDAAEPQDGRGLALSALSQMVATMRDPVILLDAERKIRGMNRAAETLFGYQGLPVLGADVTRIIPGGIPEPVLSEPDEVPAHILGRRADGSEFAIRISLGRADVEGGRLEMVIVSPVVDRVAAASAMTRMEQLFAARGLIHKLIRDKARGQDLLQGVCDALVKDNVLSLAWIGWRLPEAETLVCVAEAGDRREYPKTIRIQLDDSPEAQGASGRAFKLGTVQVINDVRALPEEASWRARFIEAGFRSSAAVPIWLNGAICGTINVYSDQADFFRDGETQLLMGLAQELSVALDRLALEEVRSHAVAAARRERQFSDAMIESIPGALYLYTQEGRFLRWNQTFERVTGYSGEEIQQMRPADFFPPEERELLRNSIDRVFEAGQSSLSGSFLTKNGENLPYYFTGKRVLFHGIPSLVGVGIDISDVRRAKNALRESERRYRDTLDNILEACQLLDFEWRYLYLNGTASRQNRRPNSELIGRTMMECWPGIERTEIYRLIKTCMEERTPVHAEVAFTFFDGTTGWFDLRVHPVPEGVFLLSVDVTERHHAQEQLLQLNASLEQQIAARTEELKVALDRAEQSDRTKSVFLATMSHELRTPLNSIIGFTGIMMQGLTGPLNDEQTKQMGMVQSSARHLLALVNDVLDISKIEAGELSVESLPVDICAVIDRVIGLLSVQATKAGLWLEVEWRTPCTFVMGDRRRIEQVLINLVNNAVKFTEKGGVKIIVETDNPAGKPDAASELIVTVSDTGIGITEEDQAGLFEPFRQIDSGIARRHEGTGLGLAICSRLLHLMGGEIRVKSEVGRGSDFSVTFPLKARIPE